MKIVLACVSLLALVYCEPVSNIPFQPCSMPCKAYENFDGSSSANLQMSTSTNLVYHKESQVTFIHNKQDNLILAPQGQIIYVFNTQTGAYMMIDQITKYAAVAQAPIQINVFNNYAELGPQLVNPCKCQSINMNTNNSFNFEPIINGFFSNQTDLNIIYQQQQTVVQQLEINFGGFFNLIKKGCTQGTVVPSKGVWGFIGPALGLNVDLTLSITDAFHSSFQAFVGFPVKFVFGIFHAASAAVDGLITFATKFTSFIALRVKADIDSVIDFVREIKNNPIKFELSLGTAFFNFALTKVNGVGILNFNMQTLIFQFRVHIRMLALNGVLLTINEHTGIATAFHRKSICIIHMLSGHTLIGKRHFLGHLKGSFHVDVELGGLFQANNYIEVVRRITTIIESSRETFAFSTLFTHMKSNNINGITSCIGVEFAVAFQKNYQAYFSQCDTPTFGGIAIGIFGNSRSPLCHLLSKSINVISGGFANWGSFFHITFESHVHLFSGLTGRSDTSV